LLRRAALAALGAGAEEAAVVAKPMLRAADEVEGS